MLHEATHQLNDLVGHTPKAKWVNEGLASYFGASKLEDNALLPGKIEPKAYPVWWLGEMGPTGSLPRDIASGRVVPLRALIPGAGGPSLGRRWTRYAGPRSRRLSRFSPTPATRRS